jgi:hypothetical protein
MSVASDSAAALDGIRSKARDHVHTKRAQIGAIRNMGDNLSEDVAQGNYREAVNNQIVGTMLTAVTIGLVIIVGILIYGEVESALPSPDQQSLSDAQSNATETFGDSMELAPVVIIVLIASLIIGVVSRFR